jgi:hypothetical protein
MRWGKLMPLKGSDRAETVRFACCWPAATPP